jgi:hypothetical protein
MESKMSAEKLNFSRVLRLYGEENILEIINSTTLMERKISAEKLNFLTA